VGQVGDAIGDASHQQRLPQCGQRTSVKACGGGAARLGWRQAVMGVGARVGQANSSKHRLICLTRCSLLADLLSLGI
jgi:hypothetical protein